MATVAKPFPASLRWLPDALTMSRFAIVGGMVWSTTTGDRALYATLLLLAVLTDIYDGAIARATGIESPWGANLDSASDLAFYLAVLLCSYLWAPGLLVPLTPVFLLFTAGYLLALLLSKRYRGVLGFHNRLTRLAATTGVVGALWIVLFPATALVPLGVLAATAAADLAHRYATVARIAAARRRGGA